jgi:hypothetical protein
VRTRRSRLILAGGAVALALTAVSVLGAAAAPAASPLTKAKSSPTFSAERIALDYVGAHRADYGLTRAQLADVEVVRSYASARSGAHHVRLGQRIDGIEVEGAGLVFLLDRKGNVVSVQGSLATGYTPALGKLGATGALARAAELSGERLGRAPKALLSRGDKLAFRNTLADGLNDPAPLTAERVWYAADGGKRLIAAWATDVEISGTDWHRTVIDAGTGKVLRRTNRAQHSGPEGTVYREQTPIAAGATRQVTPFTGLDGSWVSGTVTAGNNVTAYRDLTNDNVLGYQPSNADQHFNFAFTDDWRLDQDADDESLNADLDAAITQLFYYTNVMHDWLYGYGFDEAAGNFQVDNFGRGGSGGDPVNAEAQDGWDFGCEDDDFDPPAIIRCRNNANFNTPGDGSSPRMQMYMFDDAGNWAWADGSMDGDVIAHEYGHGVSNRLVGDGDDSLNPFESRSLGEGWSDAISFLKWDDNVVGEYVTDSPTTGVRSVNYGSSPLLYSNFNPSASSPHPNGEIWASAIYDIRAAKGVDFTAQLLLDGMKATIDDPTFLNARDGIIAADVATNGGDNVCLLWRIFAAREMGFSATSFNDVDTDVLPACEPEADAGGPYVTPEGTDAALTGGGSTEATDPSAGSLLYAWDLDNDGDYDDATGASPSFALVGQDGVFTIGLRVTDSVSGIADTDSTTVTVTNVAPTVLIGNNGPKGENTAVTVSGVVSDAGWLETPLTASIDWGDGTGPQALSGATESVRPFKTITYSEQHIYGDDGLFTVTVCAADDDTSGNCNSTPVVITNVNPTAAIDEGATGTVEVNGQQVVVVHIGDSVSFTGRSTDVGSDDLTLTWNWDDGPPAPDVSTTYFNNAPANTPDPDPSPQVNPRDVTDAQPHAFGDACVYQVAFDSLDDDAGSPAADTVVVIVAGNASVPRGAGYWQTQYRPRPTAFDESVRVCYLEIAGFMSLVFNEVRNAATVANAFDVIDVSGNGGDGTQLLDRQLLASWLNFANGAFDLTELVDADGDGVPETQFAAVVAAAETVRLNPASTKAQLLAQRDILERING